MKLNFIVLVASIASMWTITGSAQIPRVDHLTQAQLLEKALALSDKAQAAGGSASAKLSDYPNHFTMIALRKQDGRAEIHANFADFFLVIQGSATLMSGGTVIGAKTIGDGEIQGSSLQGGINETLNKGDVVHIPAGVPHQLLLPKNGTFAYFVIKVKEK